MIAEAESCRLHRFRGGFGSHDLARAMPGHLNDSRVGHNRGVVTIEGVRYGRVLVNPELERIAVRQIGGSDASADAIQDPIGEDVREGVIVEVQKSQAVGRIDGQAARLPDVLGHFVERELAARVHVRVIGHGSKTSEAEKKENCQNRGQNKAHRESDEDFDQRKAGLLFLNRHISAIHIEKRKWSPAVCEAHRRSSR
jgi:hypothetical protein